VIEDDISEMARAISGGKFKSCKGGYEKEAVHRLLSAAAADVQSGRSPIERIESTELTTTSWGYCNSVVDRSVDELIELHLLRLSAFDSWGIGTFDWINAKQAWTTFPDLQGTHLRRRRLQMGHYELVDDDTGTAFGRIREGRAGAHRLGLQAVTTASGTYRVTQVGDRRNDVFDLTDEKNMPVLRVTGRHWAGRESSVVRLSEGRWYRFPILRRLPGGSVMTAIDQSGNKVAQFRREPSRMGRGSLLQHRIEVVVNPAHEVTEEIIWMIAAVSGFTVTWYAAQPGGGSGAS
jgi:hypothetical protein